MFFFFCYKLSQQLVETSRLSRVKDLDISEWCDDVGASLLGQKQRNQTLTSTLPSIFPDGCGKDVLGYVMCLSVIIWI